MPLIGLVGPNAIGKTTACYRWLDRYPGRLTAVIADDQWEATSRTDRVRVREWKGDTSSIEALVAKHASSPRITVVDSVRTTKLVYFPPDAPVIIVTCSGDLMGKVLKARCEKNNKRFRDDYWTPWKLDYESHRRYINFAQKYLKPKQYRHFVIEDQARDWPAVDEHFYSLVRKINNQLVRNSQ